MFPLGGDRTRAKLQAQAAALAFEANRRDLDEVKRGRYLDELGVRGHVPFGLYVDGFGDAEKGSLCNAAVIPSSVIFFDADRNADPGAELGRAPRQGLDVAAEQWRGTVLAQDFPDAPWTITVDVLTRSGRPPRQDRRGVAGGARDVRVRHDRGRQ